MEVGGPHIMRQLLYASEEPQDTGWAACQVLNRLQQWEKSLVPNGDRALDHQAYIKLPYGPHTQHLYTKQRFKKNRTGHWHNIPNKSKMQERIVIILHPTNFVINYTIKDLCTYIKN